MVSLRLLLLFEFNWLYASFPLAIAIALANIREHLCSFTCTLIRNRLFIYSSHAIQLDANQVKEFERAKIFSNSRLQYFDGTLNTLQFRSDSNIFNLWQSVVICEWTMSLKIHEKNCDWNIVAAYVKMQWKKGVVSNTCLAWQKLQVDWKLSFTEPEKRTIGKSKIQQLFKIVWIFHFFFHFFMALIYCKENIHWNCTTDTLKVIQLKWVAFWWLKHEFQHFKRFGKIILLNQCKIQIMGKKEVCTQTRISERHRM